jgi:hypothetical protein
MSPLLAQRAFIIRLSYLDSVFLRPLAYLTMYSSRDAISTSHTWPNFFPRTLPVSNNRRIWLSDLPNRWLASIVVKYPGTGLSAVFIRVILYTTSLFN